MTNGLPSTVARKAGSGSTVGSFASRRTALPVDRSTTMMPLPAAAEESGMYAKPAAPRARSKRTSLMDVPFVIRLSGNTMVRLTALVVRSMATSLARRR